MYNMIKNRKLTHSGSHITNKRIRNNQGSIHRNSKQKTETCKSGRVVFFEQICFQIFLEGRQGWRVTERRSEGVPDLRGLKTERPVACRFKICFWNFKKFFVAGPKSARWLVGVKQFWEVMRERVLEEFESKSGKFILYASFNREPMKLFEKRSNMYWFSFAKDKSCSIILNFLYPLQSIGRETRESRIAVIQPRQDKGEN